MTPVWTPSCRPRRPALRPTKSVLGEWERPYPLPRRHENGVTNRGKNSRYGRLAQPGNRIISSPEVHLNVPGRLRHSHRLILMEIGLHGLAAVDHNLPVHNA